MARLTISRISKLYASDVLSGIVFWYAIEILFFSSIGIGAASIGVFMAVMTAFTLIFDIPSGVVADRWSRKGMLLVSTVAMALCSLVLGFSYDFWTCMAGYLLYGVSVVAASGTYQALFYDTLHEEGRSDQYSKLIGRSNAIKSAVLGLACACSGFIAAALSYRAVFFLSIIPCVLNIVVIASIKEPKFHKQDRTKNPFRDLIVTSVTLSKLRLIRLLTTAFTVISLVELFKSEFGQLYMLRYLGEPQIIGMLWAGYSFMWSLGNIVAHRLKDRFNLLVAGAVLPFVAMAFIDNWFGAVLFMMQSVIAAALLNQIETKIQHNTPSAVRSSVMSVVSTIGRVAAIPASIMFGVIISGFDILWATRAVALMAACFLIYWLLFARHAKTFTTQEPA